MTLFFGIFGAVTSAVLFFVFFIFATLERTELSAAFLKILPPSGRKILIAKTPAIESMLLLWWRGQFLLALAIFITTIIGLFVIKWIGGIEVEHIFTLALIAGICESIPVIGPLLAMIPAILIVIQ